jgi:hypothetical protein
MAISRSIMKNRRLRMEEFMKGDSEGGGEGWGWGWMGTLRQRIVADGQLRALPGR